MENTIPNFQYYVKMESDVFFKLRNDLAKNKEQVTSQINRIESIAYSILEEFGDTFRMFGALFLGGVILTGSWTLLFSAGAIFLTTEVCLSETFLRDVVLREKYFAVCKLATKISYLDQAIQKFESKEIEKGMFYLRKAESFFSPFDSKLDGIDVLTNRWLYSMREVKRGWAFASELTLNSRFLERKARSLSLKHLVKVSQTKDKEEKKRHEMAALWMEKLANAAKLVKEKPKQVIDRLGEQENEKKSLSLLIRELERFDMI